jgi:hypothetical protein
VDDDGGLRGGRGDIVGRLGVKARAAGISLVFAAQRPDANVMPMQLRANLGNRLVLRVDGEGTSEIALGEKGAERLLGKGHLAARLEGEQGLFTVRCLSGGYGSTRRFVPAGAQDVGFRELARRTLIARYFEPTSVPSFIRLCGIEVPPDDLVAADAARFLRSDQDESKRDAKFSVRVLPAYDFTCALTRYRMIAIDGSTPLDAAHIQQFKRGGPCEPSNGIALSKTAHWLFDRGFWSITDDYTVVVKSGAFEEAGEASQLLKPHAGRQIMLPNPRGAWPSPMFLAWHRANHGFGAYQ